MLINTIGGLWTGFGSAGPRSFYINGEAGAFFDFSAPAALFQDAAGATALTTPGQTIGLARDKSRTRAPVTSFAGIQASAGLRPTYGRAAKSRRNRLVNTESFLATANMTVTPVSGGTLLVPGAGQTSVYAYLTYTIAEFGLPVAVSVSARADGARYLHLGRAGAGVWFDLLAGTIPFAAAGMTATIGPIGEDGLRRLSVVFNPETIANGGTTQVRMYVSINAPTSVAGTSGSGANGVDGVVANYLQLEQAAAATPYQKVAAAFDMTEVGYPSYGYARLDGADDKLTVTLPAPITGDLMIFGRNGSWIEAGVTLPSGAFDLGPTGTVLTPGVLRALGDLVGVVIIGRTTTATERALALRYFAARGAAGWLVAGAELASNGGFATDTVWTKGAGWTIAAGVATHAAGTGSDIEQASLLVLGQTYLVTLSVAAVRASSLLYVWDGVAYLEMASTLAVGSRQAAFVAKATGPLKVRLGAAADADIDNVSHKLLTVGT